MAIPSDVSLYDCGRKYFTLLATVLFVVTFYINAEFGRFAPESAHSILFIDGVRSWIAMELVSPAAFINAILRETKRVTGGLAVFSHLNASSKLMVAAYLIHYLNRAILSPLRAPSRSKSHISVLSAGVFFNIINGSLMGTYLASSEGQEYMARVPPSLWYIGLFLWAAGLLGNIAHDELLMNIRRKARAKNDGAKKSAGEHYAIPHGLLFEYVSFPNYLCEWVEWLGFALATAPLPSLPDLSGLSWASIIAPPSPSNPFWPTLTPPYIFFLVEIVLMFPRAYNGHLWYHAKFGQSYPKNRSIVIPFLL